MQGMGFGVILCDKQRRKYMNQNELKKIRDLVIQNQTSLSNTLKELGKITEENIELYNDADFEEILKHFNQLYVELKQTCDKIVNIYKGK